MSLLHSFTIWLVQIIIPLVIAYYAFTRPKIRRDGKPLRNPPNTLPLVGNGLLFIQARHKLFVWFAKCERLFGRETFQISVPTLAPGVVINDPRNVEYVFRNEGVFGKGDFVKGMLWDLFGYGIINADGDLWKVQRKAGMNFLNAPNLRVLTDVALPKYLCASVKFLKEQKPGAVVDLQVVFHEITSLLMGKMAYNMEMHANDDFTKAFDDASGASTQRFQNPLWFITEIFFGANLRKNLAVVKEYGHRIVASAVEDRKAGRAHSSGGTTHSLSSTPAAAASEADTTKLDQVSGSLIQSLLDAVPDQAMVSDAALNYLSAGRDTVAQSLTWTFYRLMQTPDVVSKIRAEVRHVLSTSNKTQASEGALASTIFNPSSMPYTMAVFHESLRLYPPIPFEIRQAEQPTTLPDGTFLPKTSIVVWSLWAMGRSKLTWGSDAEQFRPERWLVDDGSGGTKLIQRSAGEFPVFNGGPRMCLGRKMAEVIAVQCIASLVWMFNFEAVDEKERVTKTSLTLPMEGGLPCFVKARSTGLQL